MSLISWMNDSTPHPSILSLTSLTKSRINVTGGKSDNGTTMTNSTDSEAFNQRDESLANIEITVLAIILALAIVGNGLMLIALKRQLKFRPMSRMYYFMLNLSIADLLVAFGNILPQLAWDITYRFQGPDVICRIVKFLQTFVLYLSTLILTAMTIDRYMVVCHHTFTRNHFSGGLKRPKFFVVLSWILAFILAIPQPFLFHMTEVQPGSGIIDCWTFLEPTGVKIYVTWFVMSVFVVPFIIIGLSYGAICVKVVSFSLPRESKREHKPISNGYGRYYKNRSSFTSSSERRTDAESEVIDDAPLQKRTVERTALKKQISQVKIKTLKLTLAIVVCFFVCWAPFCITQLILAYQPVQQNVAPLGVILLLLAALNSCTNPWIYLAFSESLCNQLRICLGFGLRRGSNDESIGDDQEPLAVRHEKKKANTNKELINQQLVKSTPPKKTVKTSMGKNDQGIDQIQPETKSELI